MIDNLQDGLASPTPEFINTLKNVTWNIVQTIQDQSDLALAEEGRLKAVPEEINPAEFLKALKEDHSGSRLARKIKINLKGEFPRGTMITDRNILRRVLGNLIKNALEASQPNELVTVSLSKNNDRFIFSVHNPATMPENVQLQVFQRSFSTKGKGRGIGTYSVKFFTEQYLQGQVHFTSKPDAGTTFSVDLPTVLK